MSLFYVTSYDSTNYLLSQDDRKSKRTARPWVSMVGEELCCFSSHHGVFSSIFWVLASWHYMDLHVTNILIFWLLYMWNVTFIPLSTQNPTDFILHLAIFSCDTKRRSSMVTGLPLLGACFLFQHKLCLLVINLSSDCSTRWAFLRSCFYVHSFWVFQFHMMTFMIITGIQTSSWLLLSRYDTSGRACAREMHQVALPGWLRKEGRLSSKLAVVLTSLILINPTKIDCV